MPDDTSTERTVVVCKVSCEADEVKGDPVGCLYVFQLFMVSFFAALWLVCFFILRYLISLN